METNGQRIFRKQHTRIGHIAALAVAAAAVLGATAACSSGSGSGTAAGSGGTGTAGTSVSSTSTSTQAGTSSNGAGGSGATSGATNGSGANGTASSNSSSGSNGNTQAGSGGAAFCSGAAIKVSTGQGGAATGHHGLPLVFTNTSSRTCTLQGYPGAAIMSGSATVLNATRTLNGFIGDERQLSNVPLVTLAPGATASAMLEWVVDNGEQCGASGTGTLEVTPPNTTVTTSLGAMTAGTAGVCADFEIHPAVPGTLTN